MMARIYFTLKGLTVSLASKNPIGYNFVFILMILDLFFVKLSQYHPTDNTKEILFSWLFRNDFKTKKAILPAFSTIYLKLRLQMGVCLHKEYYYIALETVSKMSYIFISCFPKSTERF